MSSPEDTRTRTVLRSCGFTWRRRIWSSAWSRCRPLGPRPGRRSGRRSSAAACASSCGCSCAAGRGGWWSAGPWRDPWRGPAPPSPGPGPGPGPGPRPEPAGLWVLPASLWWWQKLLCADSGKPSSHSCPWFWGRPRTRPPAWPWCTPGGAGRRCAVACTRRGSLHWCRCRPLPVWTGRWSSASSRCCHTWRPSAGRWSPTWSPSCLPAGRPSAAARRLGSSDPTRTSPATRAPPAPGEPLRGLWCLWAPPPSSPPSSAGGSWCRTPLTRFSSCPWRRPVSGFQEGLPGPASAYGSRPWRRCWAALSAAGRRVCSGASSLRPLWSTDLHLGPSGSQCSGSASPWGCLWTGSSAEPAGPETAALRDPQHSLHPTSALLLLHPPARCSSQSPLSAQVGAAAHLSAGSLQVRSFPQSGGRPVSAGTFSSPRRTGHRRSLWRRRRCWRRSWRAPCSALCPADPRCRSDLWTAAPARTSSPCRPPLSARIRRIPALTPSWNPENSLPRGDEPVGPPSRWQQRAVGFTWPRAALRPHLEEAASGESADVERFE